MEQRKLAMPTATRWEDLFESTGPYDKAARAVRWIEGPDWRGPGRKARTIRMPVGPSCTIEHGPSLSVVPTMETVAAIAANTIVIERDSMYFKVIPWPDGTALVVADHNQIIGGVWLAVLPQSEIPS